MTVENRSPQPSGGYSRKKLKAIGIALAACALVLTACGSGESKAREEQVQKELAATREQADIAALYKLQANFHRATTTKDLELMMAQWAEDAKLVVAGKTYTGKDQIRTFVTTQLAAFQPQNNWVALTHSPRIETSVNGNVGTLKFQCHYADTMTKELKSMASADTKVVKIGDRWLFQEFIAGPASLTQT